jgi:thiamine transport system ATP-binding protein
MTSRSPWSRGEVVALLGPSGCGKTTMLRAAVGLERPSAGRVCWDGADLAAVPVHRRGFGLMFQEGQLFGHRDVGGNVAFGLRMAGMGAADRAARVDELLELVGLPGTAPRAITTLSGGEQQRVALARALAPAPRLLLLDEPLSSLDRSMRERLSADLAEILRATGTTAVHVTHDHDEAFTVADRVAVMDAGRLLQVASLRCCGDRRWTAGSRGSSATASSSPHRPSGCRVCRRWGCAPSRCWCTPTGS